MFIQQMQVLNILNMVYRLRFFYLQNAVCFIILMYLVPVLFTFYIQDVLKLKKKNSGAKRLTNLMHKILFYNKFIICLYMFRALCVRIVSDYLGLCNISSSSFILHYIKPVPVAARSKAQVCGCSHAEIVSSNPTGVMDVCLK